MKKRFLIPVLGIGALAGLYAIGIGPAKEQAALHAQRCIELRGDSARCDKVVRSWLDDTTRVSFDQAMEQRKERQQAAEAKRQQQIADMHARADQAKLKAAEEIAKAEAKFKAEGWWQASNGIYVRWCTDENPCPGSA